MKKTRRITVRVTPAMEADLGTLAKAGVSPSEAVSRELRTLAKRKPASRAKFFLARVG